MIETMTGKTLTVNGSFDIAELKERIRQLDGTPVDLQQFYYGAKPLEDCALLDGRGKTIHLKWKRSK
jgi:hypothetical protein